MDNIPTPSPRKRARTAHNTPEQHPTFFTATVETPSQRVLRQHHQQQKQQSQSMNAPHSTPRRASFRSPTKAIVAQQQQQQQRRISNSAAAQSTPGRRESYRSPTKASLARFNPKLLSSGGKSFRRGSYAAAGRGLTSTSGEIDEAERERRAAFVIAALEGRDVSGIDILGDEGGSEGVAAALVGADGGNEEGDGDELPSTPMEVYGSVDPPPRGILFSTPSRRLGKRLGQPLTSEREALRERTVMPNTESPDVRARAKEGADKENLGGEAEDAIARGQHESGAKARARVPQRQGGGGDYPASSADAPALSNGAIVDQAQVQQELEHEAKLKRKAELLEQAAALEGEVKQLERQLEISQQSTAQTQDKRRSSGEGIEDLISLLARHPAAKPAKAERKPVPISSILTSFLPFASAMARNDPRDDEDSDDEESLKDIPSHRPVEVSDPLRYLRAFTPLHLTSSVSLVSNPAHPEGTRNRNITGSSKYPQPQTPLIDITIASPSRLLSASLALTLTPTTNPTLSSIIPSNISPWARRELGPFLHRRAKRLDLAAATWVLGSYWRLARKRAECWARCEREFADLVVSEGSSTLSGAGRKRKHDDDDDTSNAKGQQQQALARWLGRDVLVLSRRSSTSSSLDEDSEADLGASDTGVTIRVTWGISFDWTGEARSHVGLGGVEMPGRWRRADERGSLGTKRMGEVFEEVVRARGVFEGVRVLMGLFFGGKT